MIFFKPYVRVNTIDVFIYFFKCKNIIIYNQNIFKTILKLMNKPIFIKILSLNYFIYINIARKYYRMF